LSSLCVAGSGSHPSACLHVKPDVAFVRCMLGSQGWSSGLIVIVCGILLSLSAHRGCKFMVPHRTKAGKITRSGTPHFNVCFCKTLNLRALVSLYHSWYSMFKSGLKGPTGSTARTRNELQKPSRSRVFTRRGAGDGGIHGVSPGNMGHYANPHQRSRHKGDNHRPPVNR